MVLLQINAPLAAAAQEGGEARTAALTLVRDRPVILTPFLALTLLAFAVFVGTLGVVSIWSQRR
jgi:hypothetical protein